MGSIDGFMKIKRDLPKPEILKKESKTTKNFMFRIVNSSREIRPADAWTAVFLFVTKAVPWEI